MYSQRKAKLPSSPLTASGMQMLAGSLVTAIEAVVAGEPANFHPESITPASIAAVVYLVIFGSMVAYTAYAWLLRNAPLSLIGTYAYVNPVVAVGLGTIFLHEEISPRTIIGSVVILAAVAIVITARARLQGPSAAASSDEVGTAGRRKRLGLGASGSRRRRRRQSLEALRGERRAAQRPVLAVAEQVVGLDQRVQLAGALVDDRRLGVAQVALDRVLVRVAVRAVDLDRVERGLARRDRWRTTWPATSRACCAGRGS